MRYLKMLGLALVAAAALTSFLGAGAASATELYSGGATLGKGKTLQFSLKPNTAALLVNTNNEELDKCSTSLVEGEITHAGSSTTTTTGDITKLHWTNCTFPTATVTKGKLEIHHEAGTTNGTLTADAEIGVTINTIFFGSCVYGVTAGTTLGTVTGGTPATFHASAVAEKLSGSAFACPETSRWTGTYVSTEPGNLVVEAS